MSDFVVNVGTTAAELLAPEKLNEPVSAVFIGDQMAVVDLGVLEPGVGQFEGGTGEVWLVEKRTTSAVRELDATQGVQLGGVNPDPATERAQLSFSLERGLDLKAAAYDLFGRERTVLADGPHAAGNYLLDVNTAGLPAGMYIVRLESGGASMARTFGVGK